MQTDTSTRVLQGHADEDDFLLLETSGCQVKVHKRLMPRQYLCQLDCELVDFRMQDVTCEIQELEAMITIKTIYYIPCSLRVDFAVGEVQLFEMLGLE